MTSNYGGRKHCNTLTLTSDSSFLTSAVTIFKIAIENNSDFSKIELESQFFIA